MQKLCCNYSQVGGTVLEKLRYIKLGTGFELCFPPHRDPGYYRADPAVILSQLLDLSRIEELHLEYDDCVIPDYFAVEHYSSGPKSGQDSSSDDDFEQSHSRELHVAFNTHRAGDLINPLRLPRLRKLTSPWAARWTWKMIYDSFSDCTLTQRPVIRFFEENCLPDHSWGSCISRWEQFNESYFLSYPLSGLVLPTNRMCPEELAFLRPLKVTTLTSLKTILPILSGPSSPSASRDPTRDVCQPCKADMYKIGWRFRRLRDLRELWLAGDSRHEEFKSFIEHVQSHHNLQLEHVAMDFIQRFRKLEYIRILHRAWRIARRDDADDENIKEEIAGDDVVEGEERTEAVARELSPWEVENDLPEAFDYRIPSLFRGRQY